MGTRLPEVLEIPEVWQKWKKFWFLCNICVGVLGTNYSPFDPETETNKHAF